MENNQPPEQDPQEPTTANPTDVAGPQDGAQWEKPVEDGGEKEKEEEEAFLVSLYKFMKERHTPIERIPHLGFKQINLWKIYKAVEKLGAYEMVTGRRLWKNVYDELGGSPGSTSAATCTRRHYERLVLPYVRHLKGEEDKPLPPSKPRRQYKGSKEDKSKRSRKDKGREQVPLDKGKPEVATGTEDTRDSSERGRGAPGSIPAPPSHCSSPAPPTPSPSGGCPSPCRTHGETYKRLFSSFYSKGNHPIMSPLAKKKLLAQVSEAESLRCPGGRWPRSDPGPAQRSPEASGAQEAAGNEAGPTSSTSPGRMDPHGCQEGGPAPTVFTGTFHAYGTEGLRAGGAHPLWGCFSNLQELLEQPPAFPGPERPQEPRGRAWGSWGPAVSAWVPPGAGMAPRAGQKEEEEDEEEEEEEEDEEDEEPFGPSAKLRAVDPEGRDLAPSCHQGLPKPKAVVATPAFAALHFPAGFGNPMEHPKTQGVPLAPNPFVIPAFPSPLVVGSTPPSELCRPLPAGPGHFSASYGNSLRHRLYPWHGHHPYGSPAFHRHTEL